MNGFYLMHRGWQDNPIFKSEPYTEREAWEWLIAEASFEPHKIRYKSKMISVDRGQVPTSYRNLAAKFKWGNERVKRFISLLKSECMIATETGAGFLVVTISNYEKYQKPEKKAGTQTGTLPGTLAGTNIKKPIKDVVEIPRETFIRISEAVQNLMAGRILNTQRVHAWLEQGASEELILETLKVVMAQRGHSPPNTLNYFDQPIADAIAAKNNPLPLGKINGSSKQNYGQNSSGSQHKLSVTEATTAILADIASGNF